MTTIKYPDPVTGAWKVVGGTPPDAPSDGFTYGRKSGAWAKVSIEADTLYVKKTGDTMTGGLTVAGSTGAVFIAPTAGWASLVLNRMGDPATYGTNIEGHVNSKPRWSLRLGEAGAESGSNVGSNFVLYRYTDAGVAVDAPIQIVRSNGQIVFTGPFKIVSTGGSAPVFFNLDTANPGVSTQTFQNDGAITIQNGTASYRSILAQYVPDGRLVLARDNTDWGKGCVTIFNDRIEMQCKPAGNGRTFIYSPDSYGLYLQGASTTGAAAGVAAIWEGSGHSYRVCTSARRFKKDFEPLLDGALALVNQLKPLTYISAIEGDTPDRQPGFVAEDFIDAGLPEYVTYQDGEVMSLKYERITALLAKAVQELAAEVVALKGATS